MTVTYGSIRKLRWACPEGHQYEATPNNRTHGTGCPFCSGKKVLPGFNDLATTHPALAAQVAFGDPTSVSAGSHRRLDWACSLGHTWPESVALRVRGYGCPYCSGQRVLAGFNDLETTHPAIAAEALGWNPTTVSKGSNTALMWSCPLGHHYEATPNKRTSGRGCAYCSGNRVLAGFNDLATRYPEIAVQALDWDPGTVTFGSNDRLPWRCPAGHVWLTAVKNRVRGRGCPTCGAGRSPSSPEAANRWRGPNRVIPGENDVASARPDLAAEALGWDPATVSAKNAQPRLWRCTEGHEWEVAPARRVAGSPCPYCSGQRVLPGRNDLATLYPELAADALGWDPGTVHAGSWTRMRWICDAGHEWSAPIGERVRGSGCPTCAGRVVRAGFNDLATTHPDLAAQADGWDPTTISKGHITKLPWVCPKGHRWFAPPNNRARGVGCPTCAAYGFNPGRPAWLYLMEHPAWDLLQIGITNVPDVRMGQHGRRGWVRCDLRGPLQGEVVHGWEQQILQALRDRDVQLGPDEVAGKFDGFTEAWHRRELSVSDLDQLLSLIGVTRSQNLPGFSTGRDRAGRPSR
jgi:hypothetical protein